jgi:predicted Zn-dependent protease
MRNVLFVLAFIQIPAVAFAAPYGHYELNDAFTQASSSGSASPSVNFSVLDKIVSDLNAHAGANPVQFDDSDDLHRAKADASELSARLEPMTRVSRPESRVLQSAAAINAIATHLGVSGANERAQAAFKSLLRLTPDSSRANYLYGKFLLEDGKPDDAIPLLEKAQSLGVVYADYALGIAYLSAGFNSRAIEWLESYSKRVPTDTRVLKTIAALRGRDEPQ